MQKVRTLRLRMGCHLYNPRHAASRGIHCMRHPLYYQGAHRNEIVYGLSGDCADTIWVEIVKCMAPLSPHLARKRTRGMPHVHAQGHPIGPQFWKS